MSLQTEPLPTAVIGHIRRHAAGDGPRPFVTEEHPRGYGNPTGPKRDGVLSIIFQRRVVPWEITRGLRTIGTKQALNLLEMSTEHRHHHFMLSRWEIISDYL